MSASAAKRGRGPRVSHSCAELSSTAINPTALTLVVRNRLGLCRWQPSRSSQPGSIPNSPPRWERIALTFVDLLLNVLQLVHDAQDGDTCEADDRQRQRARRGEDPLPVLPHPRRRQETRPGPGRVRAPPKDGGRAAAASSSTGQPSSLVGSATKVGGGLTSR